MKKLLVIAVALASVNAQATRARVMALANSPHLVDTATVYTNPADIFGLGDYVNLETGATQPVSTAGAPAATTEGANAEGMVVRTMGDAKMGLSLGHQSENASSWGLRGFGTTFSGSDFDVNQQNPLELTYGAKSGDMNWAATLVYSNYQNKQAAGVAVEKESSMGVRLGARANNWDASLRLGLTNTVELADASKFTGTLGLGAKFGYQMDTLYWTAGLTSVGFKTEDTTGAESSKFTATGINVGVMTSVKKDGSEFFYGARLVNDMVKEDQNDVKVTEMSLPVFLGLEVDAASWLTLRGSVAQTVLLDSTKTESAGTTVAELSPGVNTTTVAAGAGLKFNKIVVDGTLVGATSQALDANNLLAQLGMTYNF